MEEMEPPKAAAVVSKVRAQQWARGPGSLRPRGGGQSLRVALIGGGAIARAVHAASGDGRQFKVVSILAAEIARPAPWPREIEVGHCQELHEGQPDLVVECASHSAVAQHVPALMAHGYTVIVASVGALAAPGLLEELAQLPGRLLIPTGALAGIDALAAAAYAKLSEVRLETRKPPSAWAGTTAEAAVNLASLTQPHTLFKGSAREAAQLYPKNANVAACIALAGLGFEATTVELIADPAARGNTHRLHVEGDFGAFSMEIQGRASPDNPRTSRLTALSILRLIHNQTAWMAI